AHYLQGKPRFVSIDCASMNQQTAGFINRNQMLIAIKDRKGFGHGMTSGEVWVRHRANEHPMPDSRTYSADESAAAEVVLHCQPQVAGFSANEAAWASLVAGSLGDDHNTAVYPPLV